MTIPPRGLISRIKGKKTTFLKYIIFSILTHVGKKYMHWSDVHKVHYHICKIHRPWVRGSGHWAGLIWPYIKIYLNETYKYNVDIFLYNNWWYPTYNQLQVQVTYECCLEKLKYVLAVCVVKFTRLMRVRWSWLILECIDFLWKKRSIYKWGKYINLYGKLYGFLPKLSIIYSLTTLILKL